MWLRGKGETMKVRELIELLKKQPQDLQAVIWVEEEDAYLPVEDALYEDGTSEVALLTEKSDAIPVPPEEETLEEREDD
jgi:hypothetical protein